MSARSSLAGTARRSARLRRHSESMNRVPPIDSVQHVCELRRRDSNHAIGQRWPDEAALLQPLGVERHAEPVMPKNLNQVTRSHVILHTDRNLLSFTILG